MSRPYDINSKFVSKPDYDSISPHRGFVPNIDIIHIDPIDVPMNRRITAVIMNGLLTEL